MQLVNLQGDLQKDKDECVVATNEAEKKKTKKDVVISELKEQVECLQSNLAISRSWQLNIEMFKKEALSINEKGQAVRR